jgi:hypothetical protein
MGREFTGENYNPEENERINVAGNFAAVQFKILCL